jgi:hypothetical protein
MAHLNGCIEHRRAVLRLPVPGRDVLAGTRADVELPRTPDLDAGRGQHLLAPVGEPADAAGDCEEHGVEAINLSAACVQVRRVG